ncbi:hypothetical protein GE21DRAFT_7187 [Neurospora crassa]|uniref:Uncharacterized protein n=2 Tax=Neurospora crassa TaxID=5141 RepID=Q1K7R3_NEUCR|nr:hypothetical protein NCU03620 [Neurospora crassa OR74A]EAA32111.1 hypothetical protein NCU03620 [Neurospora crassa OR74A]KHE88828.1 hypothetical protein GE21DRAFT_7187 [Neurospora crassa]CAD11399.1 hypothetical protein [Neurospora crassa]|eukprot:XP_961347.1 hypothetical protein NCU03620 [Neurospora crassa OR74A]
MCEALTDAHRHGTTRTQGGDDDCDKVLRRNQAITFHTSSLWRQRPGSPVQDGRPGGAFSGALTPREIVVAPVATRPPSRGLHLNEVKAVIQRENDGRGPDTDRPEASNLAGGEKRQARERARNWPSSRLPMTAYALRNVSTENASATSVRWQ